MTYELAKELKDAGFPHVCNMCEEGNDGIDERCFYSKLVRGEHVCFPPLEEIIEACGEEFEALSLEDGEWYCNNYLSQEEANKEDEMITIIHGKTPKEAVAKLWLTLNKK